MSIIVRKLTSLDEKEYFLQEHYENGDIKEIFGKYSGKDGKPIISKHVCYVSQDKAEVLLGRFKREKKERKANLDSLINIVLAGRKEEFKGYWGVVLAVQEEPLGLVWSSAIGDINPKFNGS